MLTMNEKDKNKMLEAILNKNEAYQCKYGRSSWLGPIPMH